jgi:DoxX
MIAYALPIARLCLAAVFLYSGVDKLWHWRSSTEEVRSDGVPWPAAFAGATVFTQLVGGVLVTTGFFAWLGSNAMPLSAGSSQPCRSAATYDASVDAARVRPAASPSGVRNGLAAGGRWIRTIGTA